MSNRNTTQRVCNDPEAMYLTPEIAIVTKYRSGPFLVSRTGDEGFNLTFSS
jgi:hypothetical protein